MEINSGSSLWTESSVPLSASQSMHGVLNVNKPSGWTSHDVVMRLRKVLGIQKIGHAGTLDPPATGVLPVLIGKGTKIAQFLVDWDKEYSAVLRLGQSTDTQDATGIIIREVSEPVLPETRIRSTIAEFQGEIQQIPPMYSAVKVQGKPLYKAARKGLTVERSPRSVTVRHLEVLNIRGAEVDLRIVCSKGTYVRTLCADIGDRLQVGGHLQRLERRRVGPLHIDQSLRIEEISRDLIFSGISQAFLHLDTALEEFPSVFVDGKDAEKVMHGNGIFRNNVNMTSGNSQGGARNKEEMVRIKDQLGNLLAVGMVRLSNQSNGREQPMIAISKVFADEGTCLKV